MPLPLCQAWHDGCPGSQLGRNLPLQSLRGLEELPRAGQSSEGRCWCLGAHPAAGSPGAAGTGWGCGAGLLWSRCAAGAGCWRWAPLGSSVRGRRRYWSIIPLQGAARSLPGQPCRVGASWRASAGAGSATSSACQEHADLPGISPQRAPHMQLSARPGNVAPAPGAGLAPEGAERPDGGVGGSLCTRWHLVGPGSAPSM